MEKKVNLLRLLIPKQSVATICDTHTLRQGLEKMRAHGYTAVPVLTAEGDYVGCVSEGDFLWAMVDSGAVSIKAQEKRLIRDIMRPDWNPAINVGATVQDILVKAAGQNFVPVVDDRNKFIGIITRRDLILLYMDRYLRMQQAMEEEEQ